MTQQNKGVVSKIFYNIRKNRVVVVVVGEQNKRSEKYTEEKEAEDEN